MGSFSFIELLQYFRRFGIGSATMYSNCTGDPFYCDNSKGTPFVTANNAKQKQINTVKTYKKALRNGPKFLNRPAFSLLISSRRKAPVSNPKGRTIQSEALAHIGLGKNFGPPMLANVAK